MNVLNKLLILTLFATIGFMSLRGVSAFFSDTETSTGNVFQASAVFPTPTPDIPTLVISEVQITGGPGDAGHDFVEFYNPTNAPFDLDGHRLVKRSGSAAVDTTIKSWTDSTIVPAYSFYLWASTDEAFNVTVGADAATSDNIGSNNSIALRFGVENTGTIIDALSWNDASASLKEGTEFTPNPGANQSMERKALSTSTQATMEGGADAAKGNGFDAGNNATDFILRLVSEPQNSGSAAESP